MTLLRMPNFLSASFAVVLLAVSAMAGTAPSRTYRVGVLGPPGSLDNFPQVKGLQDGLKAAGYNEGNLHWDIPRVNSYDELGAIVKQYIENKENLIVTLGGTATNVAKRATADIPIVFMWEIPDPVHSGLVKSASYPQTNITGFSSFAGADLAAKRLALFKETVPSLQRIVVLYNNRGEIPDHAMETQVVRQAAPKLGLKITEQPIKTAAQAIEVAASLSKQTTDGIFIIASGLFVEPCEKLAAIAIQKKLPLTGCRGKGEEGVLSSYDVNAYSLGRQGAEYVDRILKGAKPQELPIRSPARFELVINQKTAKQIGVIIPSSVMVKADKVIR